jgi:hypothetical protein
MPWIKEDRTKVLQSIVTEEECKLIAKFIPTEETTVGRWYKGFFSANAVSVSGTARRFLQKELPERNRSQDNAMAIWSRS